MNIPFTTHEQSRSIDRDPVFKDLSRSEVYRVRGGWVSRGLRGYEELKIRRVNVNKDVLLLPSLSDGPSAGIDTSTTQSGTTVLAFCFLPDATAAHIYLKRHLKLPEAYDHREFKWRRLNPEEKMKVLEELEQVLLMFCSGVLVIETDTLVSPRGKLQDLFTNLIEGCFSGYERDHRQNRPRPRLRRKFFSLANNIPIHCHADFTPLTPNRVVRYFVQALARRNGYFEKFIPLFADLGFHESEPIQFTDIIVGGIRTKIENKEPLDPLIKLPFDKRKIHRHKGRYVKAYYFFP